MVSQERDNAFVVVQLTGGNDALNTVIPYGDGLYYDFRPNISIQQDAVLHIDDNVGFNPAMRSVKRLWDEGKVAVIQGIGYSNPNRSHFRSMDIWHTAEPDAIGTEGWLGRTIRDLDPAGDNVLTAINFGRGLPRALACKDVAVTSVGDLATYGLYPDLEGDPWQKYALDTFSRMYGPEGNRDLVMDFLSQTGGGAPPGRRGPQDSPGGVRVHRRVRRQPHSPAAEGRRPRPLRRRRHPHLLHPARQLRHPLRPPGRPRPPLERGGRRSGRLLGRHEAARPPGPGRHDDIHRVRTPHRRQRHRLRPRRRRRRPRHWRRSQGRPLRRVPVSETR